MWHTVFPMRPLNMESYWLYHIDIATNRFKIGHFLTRLRGTRAPYAHCTQYTIWGILNEREMGSHRCHYHWMYISCIFWLIGIVWYSLLVYRIYDFCMRPIAFVGWSKQPHLCVKSPRNLGESRRLRVISNCVRSSWEMWRCFWIVFVFWVVDVQQIPHIGCALL